MPESPSLLYMVKQVELAVRSHLDDLLRPHGVTALQYTALTVLERHDGMSAARLARDSFVTAQSIADMVHTLEQRGLVTRQPLATDRRARVIHLTAAGLALIEECAGPVAELERRMTRALSPRQRTAFRAALLSARRALMDG